MASSSETPDSPAAGNITISQNKAIIMSVSVFDFCDACEKGDKDQVVTMIKQVGQHIHP